ncbi:hypothetical protein AB595_18935 [Massilia sp. WF1]|nr:hypothetical protein AB595_18935 [Massilia sp. WF1]
MPLPPRRRAFSTRIGHWIGFALPAVRSLSSPVVARPSAPWLAHSAASADRLHPSPAIEERRP